MSEITSSSADYQTFPTLFELEPVAGKKVTDFKGQRSSFIYSDCYCDRGRMEQMISKL